MDGQVLIYGAYGYTGSLIVDHAVEQDLSPVLAGRRTEPLEELATEHDLPYRAFSLEHPHVVESQVADVDIVLNCAGPFSDTAPVLLDACLDAETDYLDIAGRITVLEAIAERDAEIADVGVAAVPAVGFDAVPTDCLAALLADRVDSPQALTLALDGLQTFSPGTLKSIIENLDQPGAVREDGVVRDVPLAWKTRAFDFGVAEKTGVTVPWGTISTAYYSTGIGDIETYATLPDIALKGLRLRNTMTPLFGSATFKRVLSAGVDRFVSGPTPDERARSTARIWGMVEGADDSAIARLTTPDTYDLTAATAVESVRRVLADDVGSGFHTPVTAFGANYVTEFDGVTLDHDPT